MQLFFSAVRIVFLCLFIFAKYQLQGQELSFNRFTSEDGLSPGAVLAIAQDKQGFIWIGTQNGLNRFDSRQFKLYLRKLAGPYNEHNNYITSILCDAQNTLWVGTRNGLCKYDADAGSLLTVTLSTSVNESVSSIYEDNHKNIWVWSSSGLHILKDRQKSAFKKLALPPSILGNENNITCIIYQDKADIYWLGSSTGLTRLENKNNQFNYAVITGKNNQALTDNYITAITEDRIGNLWIGTQRGGLNTYNRQSGIFTHYNAITKNESLNNNIRTLKIDSTGNLWVGTQGGIIIYNPVTQIISSYRSIPDNPGSLSNNSVYSIFIDDHKTVWVGTYWGGINYVSENNKLFHTIQSNSHVSGINNNVVSAIAEDSEQNLWLGTEGSGINYLDKKRNNSISYFQNDVNNHSSLGSNFIKTIFKDKDGNIWIGTHGGGLNLYNPYSKTFTRYFYKENDPGVRNAEVLSIMEEDDTFWIGTQKGLYAYKRTDKILELLPENTLTKAIEKRSVKSIIQVKNRDIWVGTSNGLFVWIKTTNEIKQFTAADNLVREDINCIYQDETGNIWAGCYFGGLALYKPDGRQIFTVFQKKNGLAHDNVDAILGDNTGNLWISTGNGLSKFNIEKQTFKNYTKSDGIAGNIFNINACYKANNGNLYFGGYNGLTFFNPSEIKENPVAPATYLTGLKIFNTDVAINNKPLKKEIGLLKEISFTHDQNVFSLEFASLNYNQPEKNSYAYMLEGFDKGWNYTDVPSASYMNLAPGTYIFLARGANNDGVWGNPTQLNITILPPFWKTPLAYLLYVLVMVAIAFFVIRFFILRSLIKRDREFTRLKLDFFTNISHEMRTRLSLIIGPVEKLLLINKEDYENTQQLSVIRKNSESLLHLVTELMDFRKAESGNLLLHVSEQNIVAFAKEIFDSFRERSVSMNIQSNFTSSAPVINIFFDVVQMEKVFYNLIFNAYKFTKKGGYVSVSVHEYSNEVIIVVQDNGGGISQENLSKLFTNYFQEDDSETENKGYGIGLALSKNLVELHEGSISVDSKKTDEGNITHFTVALKKGNNHFKNFLHSKNEHKETSDILTQEQELLFMPPSVGEAGAIITASALNEIKHTVLLVEDNAELSAFIKSVLNDTYAIIETADGIAGWEAAATFIPDIIISDVMMPGYNGHQLCEKVKSDERTNHIPVILLTAMTAVEHQVSGMQKGADVYITKPFNIQVLQLQIANLLNLRERIKNRIAATIQGSQPVTENVFIKIHSTAAIDEADSGSADFLNRVMTIIEDNLDEPEFSVDILAKKIGMSKPILYKKLNAVAGLSVNDFVKSVRLNKAADYLANAQYNISEIAYKVGFSDPKYFSREFKKKFNESPKEWRYAANRKATG